MHTGLRGDAQFFMVQAELMHLVSMRVRRKGDEEAKVAVSQYRDGVSAGNGGLVKNTQAAATGSVKTARSSGVSSARRCRLRSGSVKYSENAPGWFAIPNTARLGR